ncbi:uncharacterized protein LOC135714969 [Ochlerotatus camptorhynchus]|uniref:uncharacterized protein LOC135714969 n=1 Tax=Ochlerotatus camptorhynchus TaxID=644619 RepID=UPI0031E1D7EC
MSYTEFQRLETTKFSIRSPRARIAKRVQQELIRASERRRRPRKKVINRYLLGMAKKQEEQPSTGHRRQPREAMVMVEEAHKYLPQCDELMQNAADLYIASELQKRNLPAMNLRIIREYDRTIQTIAQQFIEQPTSVQKQYLRAAVLSQSKQTAMVPCSDPFLVLLDLHWKQTKAINRRRFEISSRRGENIDIGPFAVNIERAESGEESDPTRLRLITLRNCTKEARIMWKRMSGAQKLPFFVQAYFATHLPASLDRAL